MLAIVLTFLFLAILFYLTLGGADFGVGIIELFSGKRNKVITKRTAYRVIGPVWEANHVWLIIVIVILWIAFPVYYNILVTQLHIPLTLLLVGIIGRGTAFVFRHYDAFRGQSQRLYDFIFEISSAVTPFFLGLTAGSLISGQMIHPDYLEGKNFYEVFVQTWLNPFSILVGLFVASLSAFISAVFLTGETSGEELKYYLKKAKHANIGVVVSGVLVWGEAYINDRHLLTVFTHNWVAVLIISVVTILLWPLWRSITKGAKLIARVVLGVQLVLITFVWAAFSFPHLIVFEKGELSMLENLPPDTVFNSLGWALLIAGVFVLPGLYKLFKTFGLLSK